MTHSALRNHIDRYLDIDWEVGRYPCCLFALKGGGPVGYGHGRIFAQQNSLLVYLSIYLRLLRMHIQ